MPPQDDTNAILRSVAELFEDARYSDLVIKCEDSVWHVHKAIVCARCAWFEKACDGRFKEASDNAITLKEDLPDVVEAMIAYLYRGNYYDEAHELEGAVHPLIFNVYVHTIGDKFGLPNLVALAHSKLESRLNSGEWKSPAFIVAISKLYANDASFKDDLKRFTMGIMQLSLRRLSDWAREKR